MQVAWDMLRSYKMAATKQQAEVFAKSYDGNKACVGSLEIIVYEASIATMQPAYLDQARVGSKR
jgi:hypothetical protein